MQLLPVCLFRYGSPVKMGTEMYFTGKRLFCLHQNQTFFAIDRNAGNDYFVHMHKIIGGWI